MALVREHGGQLQLESASDGATFRLSLPISGEGDDATSPGGLPAVDRGPGAGGCRGHPAR